VADSRDIASRGRRRGGGRPVETGLDYPGFDALTTADAPLQRTAIAPHAAYFRRVRDDKNQFLRRARGILTAEDGTNPKGSSVNKSRLKLLQRVPAVGR
jgi:hypothetical protein